MNNNIVVSQSLGQGSKGGAMVRALASHQCGRGSNPGVGAICGLSLLLVLSLAPRFFSGYSGFPLSSKTNISKFQFDQESGGRRTTMWMCYLQIVVYLSILFIYKTCFQNQRIFCRKKVNARWIQPRFGRKHIYLIQPCQNEKVSIRFNILN